MRGVAKSVFVRRLVDKGDVDGLKVAETTADQLRGDSTCAGGEIPFVDEGNAQPPKRRVEGDAGAGDTTTEDEQVEGDRP